MEHRITKVLTLESVKELRTVVNRFGANWTANKKKLIQQIAGCKINDVKTLVEYHDCLLFLLAYPEIKELIQIAKQELDRTASIAREIFTGKNTRKKTQLTGTGIAYTGLNVTFSFDLVQWLVNRFPHQVSIFECNADHESLNKIISLFLPKSESESFAEKKLTLQKFIRQAKGKSKLTDLQWLTSLIGQANFPLEVRDHLYDSLKIYVSWLLDDQMPSRTFARSLPRKAFFQKKELVRKVDAAILIKEIVSKPLKISLQEKNQLVETSRGILGMLQRETDPVTYAETGAVELFDMGRGIDIALYPMVPERRLPFDSYIGYTAFKNRLPVAYGGGWIFQQRVKIGVNVLTPYRGGESAYLFCQVLRLYHQHNRVNRFVVEPYQVGKGNLEGLQSGAFWFYYRLGFLPVREELIGLANEEFQKIQSQREYRSPLETMKKLADSNLELVVDQNGHQQFDASFVSESITRMINDRFEGNREKAITDSFREFIKFSGLKKNSSRSLTEQQSWQNFSLLLNLFAGLSEWDNHDKRELMDLIKVKSNGSELKYILQFQKHKKLNESLSRLWNYR